MNLAKQVCTKQEATELRMLGVRQDTSFAWLSNYEFPVLSGRYSKDFICAAYTSAELGQMLMHHRRTKTQFLFEFFAERSWILEDKHVKIYVEEDQHEASARAQLLIRLLRDHHITVDRVNTNLGDYTA